MKKHFFVCMAGFMLCLSLVACGQQTQTDAEDENLEESASAEYYGVLLDEVEIPEDWTVFEFTENMKLAEFESVGDNLSLNMKIYNDDHQQIDVDVELFGINPLPQYTEQASEWLAESLSSAHEVWLEWPYSWEPDWNEEEYLWCNVWSDDILVQDVLTANEWVEAWPEDQNETEKENSPI